MQYDIEQLRKKYGVTPQTDVNYDIEELRKKYLTEAVETPVTPQAPVNKLQVPQVGGGNVPVVKDLSNVGVGIGSTIGKTVLGAVQAPFSITSALGKAVKADTKYVDKVVSGINKVKSKLYDEPFKKQLSTGSGKTGQVIGTLAPYLATAGVVNPITSNLGTVPRVLARTGADVLVSQAQTGGDVKAGLATGVASSVSDSLLGGKSKAIRGVLPSLKQIGKTTASGYTSDVASGVAGMRGEDRTGAKAFIPGAGTVIGGALGTAQTGISRLNDPVRKVTNIISKRDKELQKLEDNYAIIRKVTSKTKAQGIDPKKILAQTDLLTGAVDNTGTLRTQNASIELNDFIKPQEKVISDNLRREGVLLNLVDVKKKLLNMIDSTGIKGGAKLRAIKNVEDDIAGLMLEADSTGKIPLSTIHDAKIDKYANINFLNAESKRVDKAIAKGLKELVESNTRSVDVKNLNRELQQHYSVLDLLEKLDGKKVEGGKLGKYFAQTVGGIVGSHFGPLGAIAGAEIGAGIKGAQMSSKFTGRTGIKLEQSEQMKDALVRSRQPRLGLPEPMPGSPRSTINRQNTIPLRDVTRLPNDVQAPSSNPAYSNNLGNRNANQSTTIIPTRIGISKSITIPKGSSIDKTREIVNNHLKTTLQTMADTDTFDMISANPQAFYRQQIDDIAMGLKAENPKYARLSNSIASIDATKIDSFETLASKIREKLNAKTLMEKVTGKGLPNRQGGFINLDNIQESLNTKVNLPKDETFLNAVKNTEGAEITKNGLKLKAMRFQKGEQSGMQSVRTGVFYLPSEKSTGAKFYKGSYGYGGSQKMTGDIVVQKPLFVKGATGGKAPEIAYDTLNGKGAYQKMRSDVLDKINGFNLKRYEIEENLQALLEKYNDIDSAEAYDMAYNIIENSKSGNLLPYAVQENIVANAVRNSGHDSVLGYSVKKDGSKVLSELFDVREISYPEASNKAGEISSEFIKSTLPRNKK